MNQTALERALASHQSGDLAAAERFCHLAFVETPGHPDVSHLLGLIARQALRPHHAVRHQRRTLAVVPDAAAAQLSLFDALQDASPSPTASVILRRALALMPDSAALYGKLGNTESGNSDPLEAQSAYRRAIALEPTLALAYANLAILMLRLDCVGPATAVFRRCLALTPQYGPAWMGLGQALGRSGAVFEVIPAFVGALVSLIGDEVPSKIPYYFIQSVSRQLLRSTGLAAARRIVEDATEIAAGLDYHADLFEGFLASVDAADGDEATAARRIEAIAARSGADHFSTAIPFGTRFEELVADADSGVCADFARALTIDDVPFATESAGPVVLIAADGSYFQRFGSLMLVSLACFADPGQTIHVHLVDPDANCRNLIAALRARFPSLRVATSSEEIGRSLDPASRRTYYACARFLRLPQLLAHYERPLLVNDIDAVFLGPPSRLQAALQPTDRVHLRIGKELPTLWDGHSATTVYLEPGSSSVETCSAIRAFLLHHYRRGNMPWFLDQIVLDGLARWRVMRHRKLPFLAFGENPAIDDSDGNIAVEGRPMVVPPGVV